MLKNVTRTRSLRSVFLGLCTCGLIAFQGQGPARQGIEATGTVHTTARLGRQMLIVILHRKAQWTLCQR